MLTRIFASSAGFNQTAAANGTATVPLDFADGSSYTGQLNFLYTDSGGGREKYVSSLFDVGTSSQTTAKTWSQAVRTLSTSLTSTGVETSLTSASVETSLTSAGLETSILTSLIFSNASPATVTISNQVPTVLSSSANSSSQLIPKPSSTSDTHLGPGAIAGIVGGIIACAGLAAAFVFYRRKKSHSTQAEVNAVPAADFKLPVPARLVGEGKGFPLRSNELPGDGHFVEMPADAH